MRLAALLGIALFLSASWGCGGKTTTVTGPDGEKVTVRQHGDKVEYTATGPDGQKVTGTQKGDKVEYTVDGPDGKKATWSSGTAGVALPEGFPKDVPLYPGATVAVAGKDGKTMTVLLKTKDGIEKSHNYYNAELKQKGWTIETSANFGEGAMFAAKKETRRLTVGINAENISLSVQEE